MGGKKYQCRRLDLGKKRDSSLPVPRSQRSLRNSPTAGDKLNEAAVIDLSSGQAVMRATMAPFANPANRFVDVMLTTRGKSRRWTSPARSLTRQSRGPLPAQQDEFSMISWSRF